MELAQNTINSVRVWPSPDSTGVVFDLTDTPVFFYFMLKKPARVVFDFKNTDKLDSWPAIPQQHQIVSKLRYS
ncbi:AMIN domain-containing protein, partial [Pseudoalteromonas sp. S1650]|uniref:AMIN domain-containing protein n=1 Tax=Pseudoalteromonas sp. S1650 TaxID=579509 RepID=UPI00110A5C48